MKKPFKKYQALLIEQPKNDQQAKAQSLRYLIFLFLTLPIITALMIIILKW